MCTYLPAGCQERAALASVFNGEMDSVEDAGLEAAIQHLAAPCAVLSFSILPLVLYVVLSFDVLDCTINSELAAPLICTCKVQ